jgi:ribosomal protein S18 acetylase RimI-like enzyme
MKKHMRESGGEGRPIFHPIEDFESWKLPELVEKVNEAWARPVTEAGWERKWLLDDNGLILGDAHLRGPKIATALHRCELGLGIQESARGLGHGSDLIDTMLSWAQTQDSIFWIDLHVFAHNKRAIELYESFGFQTYGMTMDLYRVHGHSIDDVHMSLQIREE